MGHIQREQPMHVSVSDIATVLMQQAEAMQAQAATSAVNFGATDQKGQPLKEGDKVKTKDGRGVINSFLGRQSCWVTYESGKYKGQTIGVPTDECIKIGNQMQSQAMARVVVPAGTKVTTSHGDTGTLVQGWDGWSVQVVVKSDKRGRIEVHPSKVFVNGRSLQSMAGGEAMAGREAMAADKAPGIDKLKAKIRSMQNELDQLRSRKQRPTEQLLLGKDLWHLREILQAALKGDKKRLLQEGSRAETAVREEIPREMWKWAGGQLLSKASSDASMAADGAFKVFQDVAMLLHEARRKAHQGLSHPEIRASSKYVQALQRVLEGIKTTLAAAPKIAEFSDDAEQSVNFDVNRKTPSAANKRVSFGHPRKDKNKAPLEVGDKVRTPDGLAAVAGFMDPKKASSLWGSYWIHVVMLEGPKKGQKVSVYNSDVVKA